jgi:hypothetical protein
MVVPELMIRLQTGPPALDWCQAPHYPQQIGTRPFIQIGETVLAQPISERRAITPTVGRVRAGNAHRLLPADQQCGADEAPIRPSLMGTGFEALPRCRSFSDITVA